MDTFDCIATKLDYAQFSSTKVSSDVKKKVMEAARLTGSGVNYQHWRFVLIQDSQNIARLAEASTTGKWVKSADFAVVILTDPKYGFHLIDAGRAIQDMQLAAWNYGVTSRLFTGFDTGLMTKYFAIPKNLNLSAAVGFGFPAKKIKGKKNRKPLSELAYSEKFGQPLSV